MIRLYYPLTNFHICVVIYILANMDKLRQNLFKPTQNLDILPRLSQELPYETT